jgi:hypothetical protein
MRSTSRGAVIASIMASIGMHRFMGSQPRLAVTAREQEQLDFKQMAQQILGVGGDYYPGGSAGRFRIKSVANQTARAIWRRARSRYPMPVPPSEQHLANARRRRQMGIRD